ncbi:MAG TPA: cupin domain-containing protein [Steroidobacteraceae bacterium]|nr:cupin domain-containing protein [Steroidobacteraceae bacterium]
MSATINGDLSVRVVVDTSAMSWADSPSASVLRKRVHLVGPPESGQVTSVVRYEPESTFAPHDHPDGEEILVLDGVFSDEHGDWPAGTYLLNPHGFRHAPFSRRGCLLFVKLRQFPGKDRRHVVIATDSLDWQATDSPDRAIKLLYRQPGYSDTTRLERWAPDDAPRDLRYADGAEIFVLDGAFEDELGSHGVGTWMRLPAESVHHASSRAGCILYIKEGGFAYLKSNGANR